mgnify:CR=1 FL=1
MEKQLSVPPWNRALVHQPGLSGELYAPVFCLLSGPQPPALIILPDDSGISDARERAYAAYFASQGLHCFIVDPFSPNGRDQCADDPRILPTKDMIREARAAYSFLILRRGVSAVGVLGIGRGGLAALHLGMSTMPGLPCFTGRFAFMIALSPAAYIQLRNPLPTGAPILLVTAGEDDVTDPELARSYAERIRSSHTGLSLTVEHLARVCHAWENSGRPRFSPEAVVLPSAVYYLESDGTYTDAGRQHAWLPAEVLAHMVMHVKRGGHLGGGDAALFASVCKSICAFILKHHTEARTDIAASLQILNSVEMRDELMLQMARCQNLEEIFDLVSMTFGNLPDTALVRIWLAEPPGVEDCMRCRFAGKCQDHSLCLRLVASAGHSVASEGEWNAVDGNFRRFPFGMHKVGVIAATGVPLHVRDVRSDMAWVADPDWIRREKIRTLLGQPLIHQDRLIGVFIIFSRGNHGNHVMNGMRMVADHMAVKIAHARAFEELSRLKRQLEIENNYLQINTADSRFLPGLIGRSEAIRHIKEQILQVAPTDVLVLITGESGTGKELVANELHAQSRVAGGPLIKVNCPTIPHDLFESEFFGHVRGSFTGASSNHIGFFEAAENGTLFLDEIGEIAIIQQSKLLRALQENEYRRVGEETVHKFHARVIAATNRDPLSMVAAGTLREDLFYRLSVFPIRIPPLRERLEDVPLLATYFLRKFAIQLNRTGLCMAPGQMDRLINYDWPGNIRELQNVIHRSVILAKGRMVSIEFPESFQVIKSTGSGHPPLGPDGGKKEIPDAGDVILDQTALRAFERANILKALRRCNGKVFGRRGAAELLGVKPTTLIARMAKLGIEREKLE